MSMLSRLAWPSRASRPDSALQPQRLYELLLGTHVLPVARRTPSALGEDVEAMEVHQARQGLASESYSPMACAIATMSLVRNDR